MTGDSWQVEVVHDPEEVVSRGGAWLVGHAIDANVIGSVLASTLAQPVAQRDPSLWLLVLDGSGQVAGVAMHRPEFELFLPDLAPGAAERIAETLTGRGIDVPGASGGIEAARAFCLAWHRLTGRTWEQVSAARVYVLDAVKPPGGVPGERGTASPADLDLVAAWADAFVAESDGFWPPGSQRELVTRRIAAGEISLWTVAGEAVSMAAVSPVVGGVARVNLVYTPPTERGHGYGSAISAAVTQRALDDGADTCMLYADVANPTSNEIYRRIGYREFADSVVLRFT
jgi:GNAT superfamily N-acetyltransferase